MAERRAGGEVRVAGRTLTGTAMRYGDISPDFRERFAPGAFGEVRAVPLNLQHDPGIVLAPSASLTDSPRALSVRADLAAGSGVLALVRRRALNGFSVEFKPTREHRDAAGVRVVERATLTGLALVDRPAYPGAGAEVRARGDRGGRLGTLRGSIPTGRRVSCRCSPGDCVEALFEDGSLDGTIDKAEVLAITNQFADVIASKRRDGVRFWRGEDGALEFAIDVPNTERGRALRDAMEVADVYGRPVLDRELSEATIEGTVARYSRAEVRAILVNPTDAAKGWAPVKMEAPAERAAPEPGRRRIWL